VEQAVAAVVVRWQVLVKEVA
jgi:hypothetical protein